jgi:hypothetical protein
MPPTSEFSCSAAAVTSPRQLSSRVRSSWLDAVGSIRTCRRRPSCCTDCIAIFAFTNFRGDSPFLQPPSGLAVASRPLLPEANPRLRRARTCVKCYKNIMTEHGGTPASRLVPAQKSHYFTQMRAACRIAPVGGDAQAVLVIHAHVETSSRVTSRCRLQVQIERRGVVLQTPDSHAVVGGKRQSAYDQSR